MNIALITGASRGIGKACAIELAKSGLVDGIAVTCHAREEELLTTIHMIEELGVPAYQAGIGDLADSAFAESVITNTVQHFGSVDILVNCAAISYVGLIIDMTDTEWQQSINANLNSIFYTCRAAAKDMLKRKCGRILNISSVWGLVGASCEVCYSATKGAINSFTKALAKELAPSGITVNAVAFGAIDTEMNAHLSEEERSALTDEIPIGRIGTAEEAGISLVKLLEMPSYFTGEVVKIDGGWI